VTVDGERRIVDPLRRVQAERDACELLAVARRAIEPPLDVIAQLREARKLALRGSFKRRGPADVHVRSRRLHGEKRRVERR
jgi:hypothetical protein